MDKTMSTFDPSARKLLDEDHDDPRRLFDDGQKTEMSAR